MDEKCELCNKELSDYYFYRGKFYCRECLKIKKEQVKQSAKIKK